MKTSTALGGCRRSELAPTEDGLNLAPPRSARRQSRGALSPTPGTDSTYAIPAMTARPGFVGVSTLTLARAEADEEAVSALIAGPAAICGEQA